MLYSARVQPALCVWGWEQTLLRQVPTSEEKQPSLQGRPQAQDHHEATACATSKEEPSLVQTFLPWKSAFPEKPPSWRDEFLTQLH